MLFTSFTFAIFFTLVFIGYWFVFKRHLKTQNLFLLACSYLFYGWWDWRFLILLFFVASSNYLVAVFVKHPGTIKFRKLIFITGLVLNIGSLVIFKYFNFFAEGFIQLSATLGFKVNYSTIKIILPLGISFYIFLSISYITDVYQSKLLDIGSYGEALLALGFFPIILAGPIQRPIGLLPQIRERRLFNYNSATDGLRQILWGMFMKIVIADKCAIILNPVFDNPADYSGSTLILALFLFSVQIYTDFAGYSNIAIGICKLLGFSIMQNFSFPYFSRDIKEFWKKWNISLTMWFRDYVFLPVAYAVSRRLKSDRIFHIKTEFVIYTIGIAITWTLTGLWHGANVTFILWGLIHGIFLILNHILSKPRKMLLKELSIRSGNTMLAVADNLLLLCIVMLTWIFFRSESVAKAMIFLAGIFTASLFSLPVFSGMGNALITMVFIVLFFLLEWHGREGEYGISRLGTSWPKTYRWSLYLTLVYSIFLFAGQEQQFIYFQF